MSTINHDHDIKETTMTKTTLLAATAATFATALLAIPLLAGSANASVTSKLQNCRYDSREKVISCCEKVVRRGVKPFWMVQAGGTCGSVVVCKGGGKTSGRPVAAISVVAPRKPKCFVDMTPDDTIKGGGPDTPNTPRTPSRGNTPNAAGGKI
jgi:hypothetical protein